MRREVTVTLARHRRVRGRQKKVTKKVVVESLTLGRFLVFLHVCARRASITVLKKNTNDWINSLTAKDQCDLTDLACPREPPRWFKQWASIPNMWEIVGGLLDTNDVARLMAAAKLDPGDKRKGTIDGDVASIAREFGCAPRDVMGWYTDEFLDTVKGLNDLAAQSEPATEKPSTLAHLISIPGVGMVC